MKSYWVVWAVNKFNEHAYPVGIYDSLELAEHAMEIEEKNRGGKYECVNRVMIVDKLPEDITNDLPESYDLKLGK